MHAQHSGDHKRSHKRTNKRKKQHNETGKKIHQSTVSTLFSKDSHHAAIRKSMAKEPRKSKASSKKHKSEQKRFLLSLMEN